MLALIALRYVGKDQSRPLNAVSSSLRFVAAMKLYGSLSDRPMLLFSCFSRRSSSATAMSSSPSLMTASA